MTEINITDNLLKLAAEETGVSERDVIGYVNDPKWEECPEFDHSWATAYEWRKQISGTIRSSCGELSEDARISFFCLAYVFTNKF